MRDVNRVLLLGNIGRDPEVKTFDNGDQIVKFPMATNAPYKDKSGQWVEQVHWHNVTIRGPSAQRAQNLQKGSRVLVEGRLETRSYMKGDEKRFVTEVMVGSTGTAISDQTPRGQAMAQEAEHAPVPTSAPRAAQEPFEDDIPF